jgi:hypothetical protein
MPTPILDRERSAPIPKPPADIPRSVKAATWLSTAFIGFAATGPYFPSFRAWVKALYLDWFVSQADQTSIVGVLLSIPAAYFVGVAIHELGHVAGGLAAGFRFSSVRIGPILVRRPFNISVHLAPGELFDGHAVVLPESMHHVAWRDFLSTFGGPLANLVTAAVLLAMPEPLSLFNGYLLAVSLVFGLGTLIPADTPGGSTDGRRIEWLLRADGRAERRHALIRLQMDVNKGVPTNESDPELFRLATAVRDDSAATVSAHLFAFRRAWLDRRRDEAGEYLERMLEHWTHVTPSMREAIMSEAAVYQARHRKRSDLAEQWLADMANPPIRPWNRTGAEAAILEAKGDYTGALAKLSQVERDMATLPPSRVKELSLAEIREWRAEVESLAAAPV